MGEKFRLSCLQAFTARLAADNFTLFPLYTPWSQKMINFPASAASSSSETQDDSDGVFFFTAISTAVADRL